MLGIRVGKILFVYITNSYYGNMKGVNKIKSSVINGNVLLGNVELGNFVTKACGYLVTFHVTIHPHMYSNKYVNKHSVHLLYIRIRMLGGHIL